MIIVVVFMFEVIQKLYDTETVIKFPNTKVSLSNKGIGLLKVY